MRAFFHRRRPKKEKETEKVKVREKNPHPQTQSRLFTLPAELRIYIFTLAVGFARIDMGIGIPNGLGDTRLTLSTQCCCGPTIKDLQARRFLSLMLTCARAHAEALPLLYGNNTFLLGDPRQVQLISRGVGAPLLQRLDFSWSMQYAPGSGMKIWKPQPLWLYLRKLEDVWAETWAAIGSLKGLRWLRVELDVRGDWWKIHWIEREGEILEPLKGILKDCAYKELDLTWQRDARYGVCAEELLDGWAVKRSEDHDYYGLHGKDCT